MKLIVGLGNPGAEYNSTRHNCGFMWVDQFCQKKWIRSKSGSLLYAWHSPEVEIIKPQTFMNQSGQAVVSVQKKHAIKPENVFVFHDDLDIVLGDYKIQFAKGPKVHNGISSIEKSLKTDQFWRVRLGIENRQTSSKIPGREFVLQSFSEKERELLYEVFARVNQDFSERFLS